MSRTCVLCHQVPGRGGRFTRSTFHEFRRFTVVSCVASFLDAAVAYGVRDVDLFEGSDLFQGHNIERVTRAVQAVAREVRTLAFVVA